MINQLIGTIIKTNFTNLIPFDLFFKETNFYLTTDMFEPIIPELVQLYGKKDLSFMFHLDEGSWVTWDDN